MVATSGFCYDISTKPRKENYYENYIVHGLNYAATLFLNYRRNRLSLCVAMQSIKKYISSSDSRKESAIIKKSLGEVLKNHRTKNKMTQEFVAEAIGVSRQSVSKWEQGISDPSTSNLFALAKLFGVSVEELLKEVE